MEIFHCILLLLLRNFDTSLADDSPTVDQPWDNGDFKPQLGIIGGASAEFKDYVKSYVKLYINIGSTVGFCGGTLIQHDKILTAGHCVDRAVSVTYCVGSANCSINASGDFCDTVKADDTVYLHSDYVRAMSVGHVFGDVALIQLKTPITHPNTQILPICRRKKCGENLVRYQFLVGEAFGCGRTQPPGPLAASLQETSLATVEHDTGMEPFGNLLRLYQEDYKIFFTTFTTPTLGRTCKGDSGGMLVFYNRDFGIFELCGITSFSGQGCPANVSTAFTAVEEYYDFIVGINNRVLLRDAKVMMKSYNLTQVEEIRNSSTWIPILDQSIIDSVIKLTPR